MNTTTLDSLGWNDGLQFLPLVHRLIVRGATWHVKIASTGSRVMAFLPPEEARRWGVKSLIITFDVGVPRVNGRLNEFWGAVVGKLQYETYDLFKARFEINREGEA